MSVVANRRSVMSCFSSPIDPECHRARIVLAEKDITVEIHDVDTNNLPEDLLDLNPYATVPTMVDRDLVLYNARVLIEYLDERFPHPPLMPVDPVSRAKSRLALFRIESDWFNLLPDIERGTEKRKTQAKKALTESLINSADVFAAMPYFLSAEFSLLDCSIAPILWRLTLLRDRASNFCQTDYRLYEAGFLATFVSGQSLRTRAGYGCLTG